MGSRNYGTLCTTTVAFKNLFSAVFLALGTWRIFSGTMFVAWHEQLQTFYVE